MPLETTTAAAAPPAGAEGATPADESPAVEAPAVPSIRDQLAGLLSTADDDEGPKRPGARGEGGAAGERGKAAKGEPGGEAAEPAGKASEGGKAPAEPARKGDKDGPGYRAYLNRKAARIAASEGQIGQRVAEVSHKSADVESRMKRVAHLEGLEQTLKSDPIAVIEQLGLKPHEAVQALLERERSGGGPKKPVDADPAVAELQKKFDELSQREQDRVALAATREFFEPVSEESHPHLAAYLETEVTDGKARREEIAYCLDAFEKRHGRGPRNDGELRSYMNGLAKAHFENSRAKFERLKKLYEPGARTAPADARKGDGNPAAPGPKGRNAEGREADRTPSLTNRASTDGGAPPSRSYAEPGDAAKALAAVMSTADRD